MRFSHPGDNESCARSPWERLAWLPILLLAILIVGLWVADLRTEYEWPRLQMILNFVTRTLACLYVAYLAGRSFLVRRRPNLLLLGCGVSIWGASGFITTALVTGGANQGITISNLGLWAAALCHLSGVCLSFKQHRTAPRTGVWLAVGYVLALGYVALITQATYAGWLPLFFEDGLGGTPVRDVVLGSAFAMFVLTAGILFENNRKEFYSFRLWYCYALMLIAIGIFGMLIETSRGSVLDWVCRTSQYLSGVYMLIASLKIKRDAHDLDFLAAQENAWRENGILAQLQQQTTLGWVMRYGLSVVVVALALGLRHWLVDWIGPGFPPYVTFNLAMMVVILLTGFGPGVLAAVMMTLSASYWILPPIGQLTVASPVDRLGLAIFTGTNLCMCVFADIYQSYRKKAAAYDHQSALRESEELIRAAFDGSAVPMSLASPDGRLIKVNEAYIKLFGYTREELLTLTFFEITFPDDLGINREEIQQLLEGARSSVRMEKRYIRKDGRLIWGEMSSALVRAADGRPLYMVTHIQDITNRKLAEERLQGFTAQLQAANRALADSRKAALNLMQDAVAARRGIETAKVEWERTFYSVPDLIAIIDKHHQIVRVNQAMANRLNLSPEECIGVPCHTVVHSADTPPSFCPHVLSMCDLTEHEAEVYEPNLGGYFLVTTTPLYDSQGEFYASVHVARDITQLKNTENYLRESEERLRYHLENSPLAVIEFDNRFFITRWTGDSERMFGWSAAEAVGKQFSDLNLVYEEDLPVVADTRRQLTDGVSRQVVSTYRSNARNGGVRHCTWYNSVFTDRSGQTRSILSKVIDITERVAAEEALKRAHDGLELRVAERTNELNIAVEILQGEIADRKKAEEALQRSVREIEDLYNLAPCGYHSLDKNGIYVRINDTELNWLGYRRDEVLGKLKSSDLMTAESQAVFEHNFPRFKNGEAFNDLRFNFIRKDGSILPAMLNAVPILAEDGKYLMSRSTIYDITDLVKAEESLRRLNLLYLTLSETDKIIAHLPGRDELFQDVCRISVEYGGFLMAWIGVVDDATGLVRPVASFGSGTDYLENIRISVRQVPEGMGPTGMAIRQGSYYICNNLKSDPGTGPWRIEAERRGYFASASLAIKLNGHAIGAVTIYAAQTDYFDPQMVDLLVQMQEDISFALDNLERESQRRIAEQTLREETLQRLQAVQALRQKEQMLIHQNRQAAMGEMIGNIAHQWRQPLNTLGLFTQRLGFFYGTPSFSREFLETSVAKSMEIIQYMSRTIDDFRNFFSIEREKSEFSVEGAITKALSLVEAGFKERRIVVERVGMDDATIFGFPNEYAQVLLNILVNAKDAINEGNIEHPRLMISTENNGEKSVVTITDNAGGIPEEIIEKIFDPYFTTKGPQQGTGVGLFMSKAIIENNMGGRLSVRNTDAGAEFRIEV